MSKCINTQQVLLAMTQKREIHTITKILCSYSDRSVIFYMFYIYSERCYDLLICNLHAYGFDQNALKLIYSYLFGRLKKVKAGSSFISELDILYGVSQGSILGPLLFNIYICDLLFIDISSDIASYADSNTPYEYGQYSEE